MHAALLTLALAASPGFDALVKQFKPATLPFSMKDAPAVKTELSENDVVFVLESAVKSKGQGVAPLAKRWNTPQAKKETRDGLASKEGQVFALAPVAKLPAPQGRTLLVVKLDGSLPAATESETWLLSYDGAGALLDAVVFEDSSSSEGGAVHDVSSLAADGTLTRKRMLEIPLLSEGTPEVMHVAQDASTKLLANGTFEVRPISNTNASGRFIDGKSKEELLIFDEPKSVKVFYRANDSKPVQELKVEGDARKPSFTVKFAKSPKPYALTLDAMRATVSCKSPDDTTQLFTREW